jgi:hypothetical protein
MTHVSITIDENVVFNGELDEWRATPPDYFRDLIRPDAKPEPWQMAIMMTMANAVMTGQSVNIEAATSKDKWAMEVTKT